jgi:hypothetical protein
LNEPDTWFLVDSVRNPGEFWKCVILNVASPQRENYKEFKKYPAVKTYYMPPWTVEEVNLVWTKYHSTALTKQQVDDRFSLYGGIPRHIFSIDCVESDLKEKIEEYDSTYASFVDSLGPKLPIYLALGKMCKPTARPLVTCWCISSQLTNIRRSHWDLLLLISKTSVWRIITEKNALSTIKL